MCVSVQCLCRAGGSCFCGAQNFAVCHFSTRFACKRNLHLNSILNSYAACNTHRAMRRGRGPEGVTLSACERQSMHACCALYVCVCACVFGKCLCGILWGVFCTFTPRSRFIVLAFYKFSTMDFRCRQYFAFQLQVSAPCVYLVCMRVLDINCYSSACTFMFHSCT